MSGIAGMFRLGGEPPDEGLLRQMAQAMAYRGPDGSRIWRQGPIGLVHCHFWTTPEDAGEQQPVRSRDGACWIAADARIDNRKDLVPLLRSQAFLDQDVPTDAQLILAAYRCWGQECARHLIGDFAFALWDARARRLLLARDVVGVRQLFYTLVDGVLSFGTTIGAVLASLPDRPALNRGLIEEFLRASYRPWVCQTAHQGLMRLPPAHRLSATQNGVSSAELYYILGRAPAEPLACDEEWLAAFRTRLDEAVRCLLRSVTPIGIAVSGGLDSSAVACVAHDLVQGGAESPEIRLYSAVHPQTPSAHEEDYFDAVAAHCPGFEAIRFSGDGFWALREFGRDGGFPLDEPEIHELRSHTLSLFRTPAADGCRVVLLGDAGDNVLGEGLYYEPLALQGVGWRDWPQEARHFRRLSGMGWLPLLLRAYVKPRLPRPLLERAEAWYARRATQRPWLSRKNHRAPAADCSLDSAFFAPPGLRPAGQLMYGVLRHGREIARYGANDTCAAFAGVEPRSPFWDRRLVEFQLRTPQRLRIWDGMDRIVLRRSLRGTLPEAVRQRTSKAHFGGLVQRGLREKESQRVVALLRDARAEALGFVRAQPLRQAFEHYRQGKTERYQDIMKPLYLEAWLRNQA